MSETSIPPGATPGELRSLAREYNWDDGLELPSAIASHPNSDLNVALELFWLADADGVVLGTAQASPYNSDWLKFCRELAARILSGAYPPGPEPFELPLTRVQAYNLRKSGLPEIFFGGVLGAQA